MLAAPMNAPGLVIVCADCREAAAVTQTTDGRYRCGPCFQAHQEFLAYVQGNRYRRQGPRQPMARRAER